MGKNRKTLVNSWWLQLVKWQKLNSLPYLVIMNLMLCFDQPSLPAGFYLQILAATSPIRLVYRQSRTQSPVSSEERSLFEDAGNDFKILIALRFV